jgi:hypothetical protein
MFKVAVSTLATIAFLVVTLIPNSADAARKRVHRYHARPHVVVAAPEPYYGMPGTYVPAPPFPFFLIPGPWWLPTYQR